MSASTSYEEPQPSSEAPLVRRMRKTDRETPFFGSLPPLLMHVFYGNRRAIHEEVLVALVNDLFSNGNTNVLHAQVVQAIKQVLLMQNTRLGVDPMDQEDDNLHYNIYNSINNAGWFVEVRRSGKHYVTLQPNARILLNFLIEMRNGMTSSWGGEVLKVLTLLETAERDPDDRSENIRSASRSSTNFLHHLQSMTSMLVEIEQDVLSRTDSRYMVQAIFELFVGKYLIEDFSRLKSRTNPFHYRDRIVTCAKQIRNDDDLMTRLAAAYADEGRAFTVEEGRKTVLNEIETVIVVFTNMDQVVRVVDESSHRLEAKFMNMIRFRDRYEDARIDDLMAFVKSLAHDGRPNDAIIDVPLPILQNMPTMAPDRTRTTRTRVERGPQIVQSTKEDPGFTLYMEEVQQFQSLVNVTERVAIAYLEKRMEGVVTASLVDLQVDDLEEALVLSQLQRLFVRNGDKLGQYVCGPIPGKAENDWMTITELQITDSLAIPATPNEKVMEHA